MSEALFATIGALGVALLLLREGRGERLAGLALVASGTLALGVDLAHVHRVTHDVTSRPALTGAAIVAAAIALAIGTFLALRWPWLLPLAALLAAPVRVPLHLGGQQAFLLVPLYGVIACAWLAMAIELWQGREHAVVGRAIGLPLALFVLLAAVSLAWSADTHQGAVTTTFFLLPFGLLAAALARRPPDGPELGGLLWLEGAAALVIALIGLAQWRTHRVVWHNPKLEISNLYAPFYRVSSVFYDPSVYGRFLAIAIALLVAALVVGRTLRVGLVTAVVVALFAGLAVSYSQSSFVALAAGLVGCGALLWRWRGVAVLVGVTAVLVAGGLALPGVRHKLEGHSTASVTSGRSSLAGTGLRLTEHHPVQGVGLGGFLQAAKGKRGNAEARGAKGASHVMPLTVAAELGVTGLVLLVWLVVALVRRAVVAGAARDVRLVLGIGLLVLLVHSLFYASFFEDPLTWGLLALLAVAGRPGIMGRA